MAKNSDVVYNAIMKFTEGNFRNRVFVAPDIPAKKLVNAQSKYITRDEPIVVLIDDTLFGSAKDGLAISENYVYAKGTLGDIKSVKISSIRSVSSQSNKLGSLDIYFGGNLFVTLSTIDKEDHDFVIGILKAAYAASKSVENSAPAKVKKPSKPVAAEPKPKNSNLGKETVACSECSATLPAGAKFCLECGTKVLPKGVCLECNAKLPEKAKFCSECGASATNASTGMTVSNEAENEESMMKNDVINDRNKLAKLASRLEEKFISNGRIAAFFENCENLYIKIYLDLDQTGNTLLYEVIVETDGNCDDEVDTQEDILDYISDNGLFAGLEEIFGDRDVTDDTVWNVHIRPLSTDPTENENKEELINIAEYNNNVNVRKFLSQYQELGRPTGQLDEQLIMLGFGTKGFSITQEDYDGESQEDEWFRDLLCDTILTLKMEVGEISVLGPCEVRCVFVQQISQKNENDVTEVVNFYIVEFQCDTILLAIYGWYDEQEFLSEYSKIISSEGVHRTSYTGYLSEMTEDLQAIDTKNVVSRTSNTGGIDLVDQLNDDDTVQEHLSNIQDKLLERGTLISLIGGGDPDVSIKFEHINPYNMDCAANFLVISITEDDFDADDVDDDDAEEFADNVHQKVSEFAGDWESSLREIFESLEGVVVRINGQYRG